MQLSTDQNQNLVWHNDQKFAPFYHVLQSFMPSPRLALVASLTGCCCFPHTRTQFLLDILLTFFLPMFLLKMMETSGCTHNYYNKWNRLWKKDIKPTTLDNDVTMRKIVFVFIIS